MRNVWNQSLLSLLVSASVLISQPTCLAAEEKQTQLYGQVEMNENTATDTLKGIVEGAASKKAEDVLTGAVVSNKNPYNSFPQHENVIAGHVVEPWTTEDTLNAIGAGTAIFGGVLNIINSSGSCGGHYTPGFGFSLPLPGSRPLGGYQPKGGFRPPPAGCPGGLRPPQGGCPGGHKN